MEIQNFRHSTKTAKSVKFAIGLSLTTGFVVFTILYKYPTIKNNLQITLNLLNLESNTNTNLLKNTTSPQSIIPLSQRHEHYKPVILMWTGFHSQKGQNLMRLIFSGRKWNPECCSPEKVHITLDKSLLAKADAVVFHSRNLEEGLPDERGKDEQMWVLWNYESPLHTPNLTPYKNTFNWVMSYRRDSDIYAPYGDLIPRRKIGNQIFIGENNDTLDNWISGKSKLLVAVISNCHPASKREKLVEQLKHINFPVDVFGQCGQRICDRGSKSCSEIPFWSKISSEYRFFYAGENSLCFDYITEKFWRALDLGMVPVVYGGANYSGFAPPNSYINLLDFKNTDALADYLFMLQDDDGHYKKYFEWRKNFTVRSSEAWHGWCNLCERVVQFKGVVPPRSFNKSVYKDVDGWWRNLPGSGIDGNPEKRSCSMKAHF